MRIAIERGVPKNRTFAWVISKDKNVKSLQALNRVAHLVGLEGEFLPLSWQMLTGPLFTNLLYFKSKEDQETVDVLVDEIIEAVSDMTMMDIDTLKASDLGESLENLRNADTKELNTLFNGINITLPLPRPTTTNIMQLRRADKEIQKAL